MKYIIRYLCVLSLFGIVRAHAAVEYLRFEGFWGDSLYGLTPGQEVFFDFAIDTQFSLWTPVVQGDYIQFDIEYLRGSVGEAGTYTADAGDTLEGVFTTLPVGLGFIGQCFDLSCEPVPLRDWDVNGQPTANFQVDRGFSVSQLTLTYRSFTPIPIPASFFLLSTGLSLLSLAKYRLTKLGCEQITAR